jgi:hypothetical protein
MEGLHGACYGCRLGKEMVVVNADQRQQISRELWALYELPKRVQGCREAEAKVYVTPVAGLEEGQEQGPPGRSHSPLMAKSRPVMVNRHGERALLLIGTL